MTAPWLPSLHNTLPSFPYTPPHTIWCAVDTRTPRFPSYDKKYYCLTSVTYEGHATRSDLPFSVRHSRTVFTPRSNHNSEHIGSLRLSNRFSDRSVLVYIISNGSLHILLLQGVEVIITVRFYVCLKIYSWSKYSCLSSCCYVLFCSCLMSQLLTVTFCQILTIT